MKKAIDYGPISITLVRLRWFSGENTKVFDVWFVNTATWSFVFLCWGRSSRSTFPWPRVLSSMRSFVSEGSRAPASKLKLKIFRNRLLKHILGYVRVGGLSMLA